MVGVSLLICCTMLGVFALRVRHAGALLNEVNSLREAARTAENDLGRYQQSVNERLQHGADAAEDGGVHAAPAVPTPKLDGLVSTVNGEQAALIIEQTRLADGLFQLLTEDMNEHQASSRAIAAQTRLLRQDQAALAQGMVTLRSQISRAEGRARLTAARSKTGPGAAAAGSAMQPLLIEAMDLSLQANDLEQAQNEDGLNNILNNNIGPSLSRLSDLAVAADAGSNGTMTSSVVAIATALRGDPAAGTRGIVEGLRSTRALTAREQAIQARATERLTRVLNAQESLRRLMDERTRSVRAELSGSLSNALWQAIAVSGVGMVALIGFARVLAGNARRHVRTVQESRARAEDALRETAALRETVDQQSIVSVADPRGRIVSVNDLFCKVSGYTREELLGKDHRIVNSGRHPKAFWLEMWTTVKSGRAWRGEVCNQAKDGTLYWVDTIIAPFGGADGSIEKYVSIRTDITERKRAEQSLSQFKHTLDQTLDCVFMFGQEDPRFVYVNDGATRQVGYSGPELLTMTPLDIKPEFTAERFAALVAPLLSGAKDLLVFETVHRHKDGHDIPVEIALQLVQNPGQASRFVAIVRDITERKRVSEELTHARDAAEAASRAKSEFLANMSHEIRTPLTAILGFADILREDGDIERAPVQRIKTIETIRSAGSHLLTVINDILDISKIEADRMTVESIDTPLTQTLLDVDSLIRPHATAKGIGLTVVLATPVSDRFMCDPTRLKQVLMNLAGNAVKFSDRGEVTVTVCTRDRRGAQRLVIDIDDTGPGMTRTEADRLFNPFSQADSTVTRKHGGTGLGLTISRRLAQLMGGDVTLVRTAKGYGSCFRLELPLIPSEGSTMVNSLGCVTAAEEPKAPSVPTTLKARVILAEDGADNQRLISFHLRKAGAEVDIAENGQLALEMIQRAAATGRPYDLLVSDMQMPVMDGYTLARTLRSRGSPLPIIALTAHAMAEDRAKCIEAGCDDYATKPIDRAKLLGACAAWIGKVRTLSQGNGGRR